MKQAPGLAAEPTRRCARDAIHDRMPIILPPQAYDRWLSDLGL